MNKLKNLNPWFWVPSLYFAEGIPYVAVMVISVIMYKNLDISNTEIAFYTSWLYLPWVIKPVWSPLVDLVKTKKYWIVVMQILIGAGFAGIAFTIPTEQFFQYTLAFFWLLAFSSATHDIAADGFYMIALDKGNQAFFVGIRSTFYRIAMIFGQGILIIFTGYVQNSTGPVPAEFEVSVLSRMNSVSTVEENINYGKEGITSDSLSYLIPNNFMEKSSADSIIAHYKKSNSKNGFTEEQLTSNSETVDKNQNLDEKGLLDSFAEFLKKHFGKKTDSVIDKISGSIAVIRLKINIEVENERQIFVNQSSGSSDIKIIEGNVLRVTPANRDKEAYIVIQADPAVKTPSSAIFTANSGNIRLSWVLTMMLPAIMFILFGVYHKFALPDAESSRTGLGGAKQVLTEFFRTFSLFFKKENKYPMLAFLLFYRFAEAQLVKLAAPFLLDSRGVGGLGLSTGEVGFIYGTIGIIALSLGGILGGIAVSSKGLKFWLWWMLAAINIPDAVYIIMAYIQPLSVWTISGFVAIEQFGYGFGFTAYMLYMIYVSDGEYKTSHYAITTGIMALGMMFPGMISGWLQEVLGYTSFFIWVMFSTLISFGVAAFVKIEPGFGIKKKE